MKRLAHYSQYFLRSPRLIKELVGHTSLKSSDTVYDIGAGSGVISSVLAKTCKHVIAIEAEPRMANKLRENMAEYSNVSVYEGDFLTMPLPTDSYKVFANIPFHLSSPIVHRLTEDKNAPVAIYLVVQKQFANKLLPESDHFTGQLGMMVGPLFAVRIRKRLRRTDFWPHPNVDTVLVELVKRDAPLVAPDRMPAYRQYIVDCFSDPKIYTKMPLGRAGIDLTLRPSQLYLHHWIDVFRLQDKY